ncbi:MAG TPA: cytochrome C oxidase subunit IV family protein [Tepidisphaeraceae bacterium]|jgi:cytochrome c oxidase subunit 4|nr:cytochrome C oxidase subunit IV family protein [Tepidisphaeraceae bacterium]
MQAHKHVSSVGTYIVVWFVLMVLLLATVLAADIDLEHVFTGANISLAMLIATVKALVVLLWFMHVKDASKLTWVFVGASFLWLGILIIGTGHEYLTRGWMPGWESPIGESYTPAHLGLEDGEKRINEVGEAQNLGPRSGTAEHH